MSEGGVTTETAYREVQYGRIYEPLKPNQEINIDVFGDDRIEVDEENLDIGKISVQNLQKGWERDKEQFTKDCAELGLDIDPLEVYKYYLIQKKVFQILGQPAQDVAARNKRFRERGGRMKLSETKGGAMCSEYAILATYIAQKIGEPVHLIVGSATEAGGGDQWREAHAYVWVDRLNCIFDSVLAQNEGDFPALMKPINPATLDTLESGKDVEAKRIGSNFSRIYGLEAGGFGVRMDQVPVKE